MKTSKKVICLLLTLIMVVSSLPMVAVAASQKHYNKYGTVKLVKDYGVCCSMQGLGVGSTYLYTAKVDTGNKNAVIIRTNKNNGNQTRLTYVNDGKKYNYIPGLCHANDMCVTSLNDKSTLFITTATDDNSHYSFVKMQVNGDNIYKKGQYNVKYNNKKLSITAIAIAEKTSKNITFFFKNGITLYKGTIFLNQNSGTINATKVCTLNKNKVLINGKYENLSSFSNQGMCFSHNKLYVAMSGTDKKKNVSVVVVYENIKNASGEVKSSSNLSFRITSEAFKNMFEIESCGISSDGKLYFNTNRRSSSSTNEDGVHYFKGYKA